MITTIASIEGLPANPYNGSCYVGIVITSGVPTYFKITGTNLDKIRSVTWYPKNVQSVLQESSKLNLLNNCCGSFMVKVLNNYLDINDRGGKLCFRLDDESVISFPVITFGPASVGPIWTAPTQGLITG